MTTETPEENPAHRDPLRFHRPHQTEGVFGDSFMERMSEKVASGMGTVHFIVISTLIIVAWVFVNHAVAFYTGALVIIAQKSQAKKDAAKEVADAKHREELAAIHSQMLQENTDLTKRVVELTDQVQKFAQDIHTAVCTVPPPGRP